MAHTFRWSGVKKYLNASAWLLLDKVLTLIMGLFVGIWVARYLGPEKFGIFSYVVAFTSLFAPLGKLGLDGIVSRNIAQNNTNVSELISNVFTLKVLGSVLILIFVPTYMYLAHDEPVYFYLAIPLSCIYVIKSTEVIEFYFRAKVNGKSIAIANSLGTLFSGCAKVLFIILGMSLLFFAIANFIGVIISTLVLLYLFSGQTAKFLWFNINWHLATLLIKESWPLIISGFFALLYLNIDQVMIQTMLTVYDLGQYSAAVKLSSLWYMLPMTLSWSLQTAIVNAKKYGEDLYYERLQQLFTLLAVIAFVLIVPVAIFAPQIVAILYGVQYPDASNVLVIHIWASLFVFVGIIRGLWVTNESYFKFALFSNVVAGILNILLNYLWLPIYGIEGAAWATLISYSFTYVLSGCFFAPSHKIVWMQFKSLVLIDVFSQAKLLLASRHRE